MIRALTTAVYSWHHNQLNTNEESGLVNTKTTTARINLSYNVGLMIIALQHV